jgi:arsenite methyltransferase
VSKTVPDIWADWLLRRRFGGAAEQHPEWAVRLGRVRERVLDNAGVAADEVVLDVGAGDGLIAFGALERGARHVVFADISADLLQHSRSLADELGVADRCSFVQASADGLDNVDDASVDVVTTRSVLIYVTRKQEAFAEFFRVLRPGGGLSIFEPINRFGSCFRAVDTLWGYPMDGLSDIAARLNDLYGALQPDSDPMLDFDERDLLAGAEAAGFFPVELDLHLEVAPVESLPWERFANTPGNPRIPSLAEAMEQALTLEERERLTRHLRPLVERGEGVARMATAYLWAGKP